MPLSLFSLCCSKRFLIASFYAKYFINNIFSSVWTWLQILLHQNGPPINKKKNIGDREHTIFSHESSSIHRGMFSIRFLLYFSCLCICMFALQSWNQVTSQLTHAHWLQTINGMECEYFVVKKKLQQNQANFYIFFCLELYLVGKNRACCCCCCCFL